MKNGGDATEKPDAGTGEGRGWRAGARKKAPRPSRCGAFARARLAEVLPELVHTLLLEAGAGSLPHLKAVLQLVELDDGKATTAGRRKENKGLEQVLQERWAADRAERDAEQSDGNAAGQNSRETADREAG